MRVECDVKMAEQRSASARRPRCSIDAAKDQAGVLAAETE